MEYTVNSADKKQVRWKYPNILPNIMKTNDNLNKPEKLVFLLLVIDPNYSIMYLLGYVLRVDKN